MRSAGLKASELVDSIAARAASASPSSMARAARARRAAEACVPSSTPRSASIERARVSLIGAASTAASQPAPPASDSSRASLSMPLTLPAWSPAAIAARTLSSAS